MNFYFFIYLNIRKETRKIILSYYISFLQIHLYYYLFDSSLGIIYWSSEWSSESAATDKKKFKM